MDNQPQEYEVNIKEIIEYSQKVMASSREEAEELAMSEVEHGNGHDVSYELCVKSIYSKHDLEE